MLCVQMHYSNWNLRQREDVSFDLINFNLMYYIALHTGPEITTIQLMDMWIKFRILLLFQNIQRFLMKLTIYW